MDEKKIEEMMELVDDLRDYASLGMYEDELSTRDAIEDKIRQLLGEQHG